MNKILKPKFIYYMLLIASITGPWTVLPSNNKVYAFHILMAIYTSFIIGTNLKKSKLKILDYGEDVKVKRYCIFLIIWWIFIAITYLWSSSLKDYLNYLIIYTMMFYYVFIIIFNNDNVENLNRTMYFISACFIISIIIGLLESRTNFRLWGSPYVRGGFPQHNKDQYNLLMKFPTAFFGNPNDFATFILFGISFLMSFILYSERNIKYYVLLILSLLVLYFSNSRANFLSVLLVFVVFVFLKLKPYLKLKIKVTKNTWRIVCTVLILLVLIVISVLYIKGNSFIRMLVTFDFSDSSSYSTRYRAVLISDALHILRNNPFGVGAGNTAYHLGVIQGTGNLSLHNGILELGVDFGIPILISYLVFYVSIIVQLYKCIDNKSTNKDLKIISTGCFLSLLGFVIGVISPSGIVYFIPHWFIIGISLAVINVSRKYEYKYSN